MRRVVVANRAGLHARAAGMIVTTARRFDAKVFITKGVEQVESTDMLQLLMLGAQQGEELELAATGTDSDRALDAIEQLFVRKFDED